MRSLYAAFLLLPVLASAAQAATDDATLTGRVVGPDGKPLADAFIQQEGALASAVSDDRGMFTLRLDPKGRQALSVSEPGYVTQEVAASRTLTVTLQPVPTYRPTFTAIAPEAPTYQDRMFDTQVGVSYRGRYFFSTSQGRTVEGIANNEIYGVGRYRVGEVVFNLDGWRVKAPETIAGLTTQPSSPLSLEMSQWTLSTGYHLGLAGLDLLPQVGVTNAYEVPSGTTPWTGTPLDYSQSRVGPMFGLEAGTRLGDWEIVGKATYLPVAYTTLTSSPLNIGNVAQGEVGLTLGYNMFPGLRADLSVARQFAWAERDLGEWSNVAGVGLTYHPERLRP